jgi:hypothetical protein
MQTTRLKSQADSFNTVLSAVKKFSAEEKQLLRLQLFAADALSEMKVFEAQLKKRKKSVIKRDDDIVKLTTSIRLKKHAEAKKMLH